jgi:hypothetical protein
LDLNSCPWISSFLSTRYIIKSLFVIAIIQRPASTNVPVDFCWLLCLLWNWSENPLHTE